MKRATTPSALFFRLVMRGSWRAKRPNMLNIRLAKSSMQFFSRRLAVVLLVASIFLGSVHAQALQRVEQADFGKTRDGTEVKLIILRNSKGMSAEIITYGAIIKELMAPDRDGHFGNLVLTTDSIEKFERFNGAAAIIGRVINRIAGAQFVLDGTTYQLPANNGRNTIHGGRKGFAQS